MEYEAQQDASNWQTDMAAGTGMLMMAIPEFPNTRQWLENANMILRSQLKINVNKDGSWPESIRYHFFKHSAISIIQLEIGMKNEFVNTRTRVEDCPVYFRLAVEGRKLYFEWHMMAMNMKKLKKALIPENCQMDIVSMVTLQERF